MTNYTIEQIEKECEVLSNNLHTQLIFCMTSQEFNYTNEANELMNVYQKVTSGLYDKVCLTNLKELADQIDALKRASRLYSQAQQDETRVLQYIYKMERS